MIRDTASILRAFEHLVDLLHEEDVDSEIIATVESAREMLEEEFDSLIDDPEL